MKQEEFKVKLKGKLESTFLEAKQALESWWYSDDGLTLQNSLLSLGALMDYGYLAGMVFPYLQYLLDPSKRRRFTVHIKDLDVKLREGSVNKEFARSELGHKIFENTIKIIIEEIDDEKIEAHKTFLLTSYTKPDMEKELLASYHDTLLSLRSIELQIFRALHYPDGMIKKIYESKFSGGDGHADFVLKTDIMSFLEIEPTLFEKSIKKLTSEDLITREGLEIQWMTGNYHKSNMHDGIKRATTDAHRLITDYGKKFMGSITKP